MALLKRKPARQSTPAHSKPSRRAKVKSCSCKTKNCAHKVNAAEIKGFERGYNQGLQHGRLGH